MFITAIAAARRRTRVRVAVGLLAVIAGLLPCAAAEQTSFLPIRIGKDGAVPEPALAAALAAIQSQGVPQHIVILIHGWDTPCEVSSAAYSMAASRFQTEFQRLGAPVQVIGLQWPSSAGAMKRWLPASVASFVTRKLGFRNAVRDPYLAKVPVARAVGRVGLRQICFGARQRFPAARIHLIGHSMGSEVVAHALEPMLTPIPEDGLRPFEPGRPCEVDLVGLLGSDLDYDAAAHLPTDVPLTAQMMWITFPKLGAARDQALRVRRLPRGKAALGNRTPMLRADQYDVGIRERRLVYDVDDIPRDHKFGKYLSQRRVRALVEAAVTLDQPQRSVSSLLGELDAILREPDDPAALAPYLDRPGGSAPLYALWRLERSLCGDSRHLVSGYSLRVLRKSANHGWLARERQNTDCRVVREGLWPCDATFAGAQQLGRPVGISDPNHREFLPRHYSASSRAHQRP